ncbi:MAG TPA: serine hydrolase domain-containing protein [Acidimicrobiia bacterium]|nr:serine hydrolase domain-containing protein [Acidimicrobiia bacterium]
MGESNGTVAPGFEGVREAFEKNFSDGLEIGASFGAYHHGEKVVDLWGGVADQATGRAWDERTLALVFSTTKGVTAVCANKLAQDGMLDMDAPVARYWPEFAAGGKAEIPVSYLLSHQAGLAWIDGEMTAEEAFSWDPVVDALAQQEPHWEPGTKHGYHATTYGWLVGEVIKRVTGESVGTYFGRAIAEPLGLDFWIGLPESEESRVAPLVGGLADPALLENPEVRALMDQFVGPHTVLGKALFAPGGAFSGPEIWNTRALHAAEVPAAGGIGDARSLARLYAACIGPVDGIRVLDDEQLRRATTQLTSGPNTVLLDMDIQFGLGFMLRSSLIQVGGPRAFGHFGAGGSVGWADPDAGLAFGYVMNRMDIGLAGDLRSFNLVNACYEAIGSS